MMKKAAAVILTLALCTTVMCGCSEVKQASSPTPTPIPEIIPSTLLTINDASTATGVQLVQSGDIVKEENTSVILYRSEPIGAADTVRLSITQYGQSVSKEQVQEKFNADKAKRSKAEDVEGMENCFIAFPSIYYYKDGYYLKITAGSGDSEAQKNLLVSLMKTAAANLDVFTAQNN